MRKVLVGVTLAAGVLTGTFASALPAMAAPPSVSDEIAPMLWADYRNFDERQEAIDVGEYGLRVGWWRAYHVQWVPEDKPWKLRVDYI